MHTVDERSPVAEHCESLVFLCATLEVEKDRGGLTPELEQKLAEAEALVEEGDALELKRKKVRRGKVKTEAKIQREDRSQEQTLTELWADCMAEARQDKEAPVVQTAFEGGLSRMLKPALEAQTQTTRTVLSKVSTQPIYDGPLRAKHAPLLTEAVDRATELLGQREADTRANEAASDEELEWKRRGNALRTSVGALLTDLGVTRGEPSALQFARSFFRRG